MHAQFKDIKDCLAIHFESQAPAAEAQRARKFKKDQAKKLGKSNK